VKVTGDVLARLTEPLQQIVRVDDTDRPQRVYNLHNFSFRSPCTS
jgi:hypothetical protein